MAARKGEVAVLALRRPSRRLLLALAAVIVVAVAAAIIALIARPATPPLVHEYTKSPTAFSFRYPDGWMYQIPQVGVLILARPTTFQGVPGPSFTIHRSNTLAMEGSLEAALDEYLRRGPLRPNREWALVQAVTPTTFKGRQALTVEVQGSEFEGWPELRTRITALRTGVVTIYLFVQSAPVDQWESERPLLESILNSVEIYE